MVIVCLFAVGCKKKGQPATPAAPVESVITNRVHDAAYLDSLKKGREFQTKLAAGRAEVSKRMAACRARVSAALPKDAVEAAVNAALEKDSEWQGLVKQFEELVQKDQKSLAEVRDSVRARLQEEARAIKAVADGKAKAVDTAAPLTDQGSKADLKK